MDPLLKGKTNSRPNLFVLTGAKCEKILTDDSGSDGVQATGVSLIPDGTNGVAVALTCGKEVILSAGALGSPQLLMESGIGPQGAVKMLSRVGQNLQDHLVYALRFGPKLGQGKQNIGSINAAKAEKPGVIFKSFSQMFFQSEGILTSAAYDASLFFHHGIAKKDNKYQTTRPNIQLSAFCTAADKASIQGCLGLNLEAFELGGEDEFKKTTEGFHILCAMLRPKSQGHLKLSADADNGSAIEANNFSDAEDHDMEIMVAAVREGIRIGGAGSFQGTLSNSPVWPKDLCHEYKIPLDNDGCCTFENADDYPVAFLEACIRRYATTKTHPTSTCRIGKSDKEGVVDSRLKVYGVKNLRVADASVQPTVVSGNTQASCVVIGEKAADLIREDYQLQSNPEALVAAVEEYEKIVSEKRMLNLKVAKGLVTIGGLAGLAAVGAVVTARGRGQHASRQ